MNTETLPEPEPKSAFDFAITVLTKSEEVTTSRRLLIAGAMLGTCFVFLSSMLGLPHLDAWLTIALCAFAVAIPLLVFDFIICTYNFSEHTNVMLNSTTYALMFTAWTLGGAGAAGFAVLVGVVAVVVHLSGQAIAAGIVAILFASLTVMALIIVFKVRFTRATQRAKRVTVATPASETTSDAPTSRRM